MSFIVLETPFKSSVLHLINGNEILLQEQDNITYARACMKDCLLRGEAVFASHLLYTQPGVLDDTVVSERKMGIMAGLEVGKYATKRVFYLDHGFSTGMRMGLASAIEFGQTCELRLLGGIWDLGWCREFG